MLNIVSIMKVQRGPLTGVRVVEMAGLGPVPFASMMLADMGVDVVRIDSPPRDPEDPHDHFGPIWRGRAAYELNLKDEKARQRAIDLINRADIVLEGFRPGVMERLGLGPDVFEESNPGLIYGRMTGWGQGGELARSAGHDVNYLAVGGVLHHLARRGERPLPPLNLVGDYGGGGMLLVVGVLAAYVERTRSGRGQVIDAAMLDGAALLMTSVLGWRGRGNWNDEPGTNTIDTGSPFYEVYRTADDRFLAVGAIEPRFYRQVLVGLGLDEGDLPPQYSREDWPAMKEIFAARIAQHDLAHWDKVFAELDACVSPVLNLDEAARHPHVAERAVYVTDDGYLHPSPAPRFSRTPSTRAETPHQETLDDLLSRWG
ncbi:CaiB/BaiF CoA transferase family protein [Micromonospora sp. NPDC049051]|uniref:CaiB/BaiF CoA transferase family protein n=1 Tax=Micromonospora sp. NPDC049051 TaxID=3364264 RepID=UPI00371DE057